MKKNSLWILALCFGMLLLTACDINITTNAPGNSVQNQNPSVETNTIVQTPVNDTQEIKYTEVKASTAKDLFQNIRPNARIILTEEYYNISYIDPTTFSNEYVKLEDCYDGYEFIIHNVKNLEIVAASNVLPEIVTEGAHVNVISLMNCDNVKLDGIIAGHEVEKGSCTGGVVSLISCNNIQIDNCHLYGCGIYGISAKETNNVTVNNTEIYECSYGLLDVADSNHFTFNNCTLRDSEEYNQICFRGCLDVTFNNCTIRGNRCWESASLLYLDESPSVTFNKCVFKDNTYNFFWAGDKPNLIGCKAEDTNFGQEYYYDVDPYYEEDDEDYYYDVEPEYDI